MPVTKWDIPDGEIKNHKMQYSPYCFYQRVSCDNINHITVPE